MKAYFEKNKNLFRLILLVLLVFISVGVWLCWLEKSRDSESISTTQSPVIGETSSSPRDIAITELEETIEEIHQTEELVQGGMSDGDQKADSVQRIFFMHGWDQPRDLLMANPDGSFITYLAKATGSLDVTQDGTKLAAGCENPELICIYDITKIPNYRVFPFDVDYDFFNPQRTVVSTACSLEQLDENGIHSLSWSKDGSKLAYVCEGHLPDEKVICVHGFDNNKTNCQDGDIAGYGKIRFASYSPNEELLLVSVGEPPYYPQSRLLIINESKEVIRVLGWGDEGAWSPDGKQIAYVKDSNRDGDESWGYFIINKDGSRADLIFSNDRQMILSAEFFHSCEEISLKCGMSWSTNGNQLFFGAAVSTSGYFYQILRYDFEKDQILNLTWRNYGERQYYTLPVFAEISK